MRESETDALLRMSLETYKERRSRSALRCGLGDASVICDLIAKEIMEANAIRGGRIRKEGVQLAAVATMCGNAIWKYRDKIVFEDTDQ